MAGADCAHGVSPYWERGPRALNPGSVLAACTMGRVSGEHNPIEREAWRDYRLASHPLGSFAAIQSRNPWFSRKLFPCGNML